MRLVYQLKYELSYNFKNHDNLYGFDQENISKQYNTLEDLIRMIGNEFWNFGKIFMGKLANYNGNYIGIGIGIGIIRNT